MPKVKKIGRPKLPKGHAKGKIVPVRLNDAEVKHFMRAAKANEQTLSEWVREELRLWDDRLDENGIDGIVWQGANQGDPYKKTLWIIFKEIRDDNRVTVSQDLFSNKEQSHYESPIIEEGLQKRGIEKVWVTTTKTPFIRSRVHLQIVGLREPITILKRY